jgi:hypothetical protein
LSYCGIKAQPERFEFSAEGNSPITSFEFEGVANQVSINEREDELFFGHQDGNFQPLDATFDFDPVATGGQVSNSKVAEISIDNKDGVGNGKDSYTLYLGDGYSFPKKSQWASFEHM